MEAIRLEYHAHTIYSKDSLTKPQALVAGCRRKGIDRIVVTDHNTIRGALACKEIDPELIIVGEEIMTRQGELLAAFVTEEIPKDLDAMEAIHRLRNQGAFISVSHPFDLTRSGHWKPGDLDRIAPHVDAIEVFNARCLSPTFNTNARKYAETNNLPGTVGSDAHGVIELGAATILIENFNNAEELRQNLASATYETRLSPPWMRLVSRNAVIYKSLFKSAIP